MSKKYPSHDEYKYNDLYQYELNMKISIYLADISIRTMNDRPYIYDYLLNIWHRKLLQMLSEENLFLPILYHIIGKLTSV